MSTLKDVLCLFAIFVAYGLAGHLDYEDAVLQEKTQRPRQQSESTESWMTHSSPTRRPATRAGHQESANDTPSDLVSGTPPDGINLCPPEIY